MVSWAMFHFLALLGLVQFSTARITSRGLVTAPAFRADLPDSSFLVRRTSTPTSIGPNRRFFVFASSPATHPALANTDTQIQVNTVIVKAGKPFFKHYHPRGVETIVLRRGTVRSQTWFEGNNPRVVTNLLKEGDATVYPQGLPHLATCVGKIDCVFTAVFNSADAGTVPT